MVTKIKIKELTTISILVALMIAQNYILYSIPFTLTYVVLYVITKRVKPLSLSFLAVMVFVAVKNIVYAAFPTTIIMDLVGLSLFILVAKINIKWLRYTILPLVILLHILMLDFSIAILVGNVFKTLIAYIISGFITYIYAPLSVILIYLIDGISFITTPETDD